MERINCDRPRSMYLFLARVNRVLYKNHKILSKRLLSDLFELEMDAKNYYFCDAYFERTSLNSVIA